MRRVRDAKQSVGVAQVGIRQTARNKGKALPGTMRYVLLVGRPG